jgi:hypothetical protein
MSWSENEQLAAIRPAPSGTTARQGMPPKPAGKMPALRRRGGRPAQSVWNQGPSRFVRLCQTIFLKKIKLTQRMDSNDFRRFPEISIKNNKFMMTGTGNKNDAMKRKRYVVPFNCRGPRLEPTHPATRDCYKLTDSHPEVKVLADGLRGKNRARARGGLKSGVKPGQSDLGRTQLERGAKLRAIKVNQG